MGSHVARLALVLGGVGTCGADPTSVSPLLLPWANLTLAGMLRGAPEALESVYDPTVLGNLAKKSVIADLRVPHSQSFVIDISVGTPPQTLRCLLDTGFADLWLPSEVCKNCHSSHRFLPERSRTYSEVRATGSMSSLFRPIKVPMLGMRMSFKLSLGQDTVALGWGIFKNQSFLLLPQAFLPKERDWDGICGLGRHQIAVKQDPLWKRLPSASPGGHAIFSLVPGTGRRHYFMAGEVPYKACKEGTLSWAPVEPLRPGGRRDFWVVEGGLAIHKRNPVRSRFLLDTGSSFLLAPPHKYLPFMRSLFLMGAFDRHCGWDASAGNVVVCNCSIMEASAELLPLRVYVGGRPFLVQIPELFVPVATGVEGSQLCLLQIQRNPTSSVDPLDLLGDLSKGLGGMLHKKKALGQAPLDLEDDLWVIGGVFLERFVVVLDFEGQRVGVAEPSGEALSSDHVRKRDFTLAENVPQEEGKVVGILRDQVEKAAARNAELKAQVHDLVRAQEEGVMKEMKEEARKSSLEADMQTLDQQNRELQSRVQNLQYSQEQDRAQYLELQEELAARQAQWNRLRADLQELRQRHAALQIRSSRYRQERNGFQVHGVRMQLLATTAWGSMAIFLLCGLIFAWKARYQLAVCALGVREVRDVAPLLHESYSAASPEEPRDADVEVE